MIETLPRDVLFEVGVDELTELVTAIVADWCERYLADRTRDTTSPDNPPTA